MALSLCDDFLWLRNCLLYLQSCKQSELKYWQVQLGRQSTLWIQGVYTCIISTIFTKDKIVLDFLLAFLEDASLTRKGTPLKGKNLLLKEQILSFKN